MQTAPGLNNADCVPIMFNIQTRHVFVMSPGLPLIYVCVCVCVYVVYEDTNLYNDMGMTQVLQGEGDL